MKKALQLIINDNEKRIADLTSITNSQKNMVKFMDCAIRNAEIRKEIDDAEKTFWNTPDDFD